MCVPARVSMTVFMQMRVRTYVMVLIVIVCMNAKLWLRACVCFVNAGVYLLCCCFFSFDLPLVSSH